MKIQQVGWFLIPPAVAAAALWLGILFAALDHSPTRDMIAEAKARPQGSYTIHRPKSGCPIGWIRQHAVFTEKDGSHGDGCDWYGKSPWLAIDELLPGESVDVP